MTTEARELYCYVTGTEPFASEIEKVNVESVAPIITIRQITKRAMNQYVKDYCTNNENPFSDSDFRKATQYILDELKGGKELMSKCEYAREYCDSRGFDYFEPTMELEWRKPINNLEEQGVFFIICDWIKDNLLEDTFFSAYDNIHGWRENVKGGSFNPDDNFKLYDIEERLELSDFILNGTCVYAEITDTKYKEVVGYIRLH